jgi:tRNA threonylcarbamoyladenosine biosynthesis protein TsaE
VLQNVQLPTRRDTTSLGRKIAAALKPGDLVLLSGDLGAGKTFLARAIARALGVPVSIAIPSPTFTLVQEYETFRAPPSRAADESASGPGTLLHVDLYRLRDDDHEKTRTEVRRLGLADRRGEGAILVVEWGQGLSEELGGPALVCVEMTLTDEGRVARIDGLPVGAAPP